MAGLNVFFFLVCSDRLKWTWQSCSPLSVGFLSGPRKSAGETEQSRWSPDAAALQGSSARTRKLERIQQHTAWTLMRALTPNDRYMNLQLRYKYWYNSAVRSYSCWFEQIINQEIDNIGHKIFSIVPLLLLPEGRWWTTRHTGKWCQPSGYERCQECGKLIKDSQLSLGLHKLGRIGLACGWEIDGNLHIS